MRFVHHGSQVVEADPKRKHVIMNDWHLVNSRPPSPMMKIYVTISLSAIIRARTIRKYIDFDVAFITTTEMDKNGYFNYGPVQFDDGRGTG